MRRQRLPVWFSVDNFIIVAIPLDYTQTVRFHVGNNSMKDFMQLIDMIESDMIRLLYTAVDSVHSHVNEYYIDNLTIGNICYRVICTTRRFCMLTFSPSCNGKILPFWGKRWRRTVLQNDRIGREIVSTSIIDCLLHYAASLHIRCTRTCVVDLIDDVTILTFEPCMSRLSINKRRRQRWLCVCFCLLLR